MSSNDCLWSKINWSSLMYPVSDYLLTTLSFELLELMILAKVILRFIMLLFIYLVTIFKNSFTKWLNLLKIWALLLTFTEDRLLSFNSDSTKNFVNIPWEVEHLLFIPFSLFQYGTFFKFKIPGLWKIFNTKCY